MNDLEANYKDEDILLFNMMYKGAEYYTVISNELMSSSKEGKRGVNLKISHVPTIHGAFYTT